MHKQTNQGWEAWKDPITGKFHAVNYHPLTGEMVFMEDVIMKTGPDEYVFHKDGNTLNNTRPNMELRKRNN